MGIINYSQDLNNWMNLYINNNYDYQFFLVAQKVKLERMIDCFEEENRHVTTKHDITNIQKAIVFLNRLMEDDYTCFLDWLHQTDQKQKDLDAYLTILSKEIFNCGGLVWKLRL